MIDIFELKYRKVPVKVRIKGVLGFRDYVFIIDTGASYSIVNKNFIESIGYNSKNYTKTENLSGFGGNSQKVNFLKLNSISCLGLIRRNIEIGVMEFSPKAFYDGILGIDFFVNHKLTIDFKKGTVALE